jgi:hypothetical protein
VGHAEDETMNEVIRRKEPMNKSIVDVDSALFSQSLMGWLEVTHYVMGQRAGTVKATEDGSVPPLNKKDYVLTGVQTIANDSVFAFAIAAALKGDKPAVDFVEKSLTEQMGENYPGYFALFHFHQDCDEPETLDDWVGKIGKSLLAGENLAPRDKWNAILRFYEKARKSNFIVELMPKIAQWGRDEFTRIFSQRKESLHEPETNLPPALDALKEDRNDEPFIAAFLIASAPVVDMELNEDYMGLLKSVSRR